LQNGLTSKLWHQFSGRSFSEQRASRRVRPHLGRNLAKNLLAFTMRHCSMETIGEVEENLMFTVHFGAVYQMLRAPV
jgi:hypothetical protein